MNIKCLGIIARRTDGVILTDQYGNIIVFDSKEEMDWTLRDGKRYPPEWEAIKLVNNYDRRRFRASQRRMAK